MYGGSAAIYGGRNAICGGSAAVRGLHAPTYTPTFLLPYMAAAPPFSGVGVCGCTCVPTTFFSSLLTPFFARAPVRAETVCLRANGLCECADAVGGCGGQNDLNDEGVTAMAS
eukprot:1756849-Rhodomonas_salina.1